MHAPTRDLAPELRQFTQRVLIPFVGLIALTLAALCALVIWSASETNRLAANSSQELARVGVQTALRNLGSNAAATATWDDAVEKVHLSLDSEWATANIGNWATDSLHFEMTFILDPRSQTQYSLINGEIVTQPTLKLLGPGLTTIVDQVRTNPLGEAVTGIIKAGDQIVMVGAAAIHPHTSKLAPISGGYSVLVYGDLLDAEAITGIQRAYLLDGLAYKTGANARNAGVLPLLDPDRVTIGHLEWKPDRPGDKVLRVVLPVLAALAMAIGVLATFMLFHARQVAGALSLTRHLALTDSLTDLPNRRRLEDRLGEVIHTLARDGGTVAVLCLDLDGFKQVNDVWGHAAGDELLRQTADRLRAVLRSADIISRVGGDEFVVVLTAHSRSAVEKLAGRLLTSLRQPVRYQDVNLSIATSIGISFAEGPHQIDADLVRAADKALYEAKLIGGNTFRVSKRRVDDSEHPLDHRRTMHALAVQL